MGWHKPQLSSTVSDTGMQAGRKGMRRHCASTPLPLYVKQAYSGTASRR